MERYCGIQSAAFGETTLGLPLGLRLRRRADALPAAGDADAFVTSVQLSRPALSAELRLRDTAAAEALALGAVGELVIELAPTRADQPGRTLTFARAVLTGIELEYQQTVPATATLLFQAEADAGDEDPFTSEETQT